jgi:hypothetical protein
MSDDDLGPLPQADANSALQRESLAAINAMLSHAQLVIRDERADDYGVDASLEILVDGAATNFRSHLQVKARTKLHPNNDGSISLKVPTSNLNYLLSGPCPLYVLYRPEAKELRYVFARDEERRVSSAVPEWKKQESVSLRFVDTLDSHGLDMIRARIVQEAHLHRKLSDVLAAVTPGGSTHLRVEPSSVTVDSQVDAAKTLVTHGMTLVASGHAAKVLELARLLHPEQLYEEPKLLLVQGYAEFFSRNYLAADPHLRQALASEDGLIDEDRRFLAFLVNAVELAMGQIDNRVFRERSDAWRVSAPRLLAIQYDILHYWTLQMEATSEEQLKSALANLDATLQKAKAEPDLPRAVRLNSRLLEFFLEARRHAESVGQAMVLSKDQELWRHVYNASPETVLKNEFSRIGAWRSEFSSLLTEIRETGNAALLCEGSFARDISEALLLSQFRIAAAVMDFEMPAVAPELVAAVQKTQALAQQFHQTEIYLRTLLIESDLEDMRGNSARADELSRMARTKSSILRYADIERSARKQLSGEGRSSRTVAEITGLRRGGFAAAFAAQTDEDLAQQARASCEMLGIPQARAPIVLDVARCARAVAQEQVSWCRHLDVLEVGTDNRREVLYQQQPEHGCVCKKFGYRSARPSRDWRALIDAFKRTPCASCGAREPQSNT